MRYVIYGVDATSQSPCPPLTVDAHSEEEARNRAVARGMAVRAVMADAAAVPPAEPPRRQTRFVPRDAPAAEPDKTPGARPVRMVLLPLAIAFFLVLALVRSAVQAATWAFVWGLGLLLGGGLTGLFRWLSRGAAPVETCWPIGVAAGLTVSALPTVGGRVGNGGGPEVRWARCAGPGDRAGTRSRRRSDCMAHGGNVRTGFRGGCAGHPGIAGGLGLGLGLADGGRLVRRRRDWVWEWKGRFLASSSRPVSRSSVPGRRRSSVLRQPDMAARAHGHRAFRHAQPDRSSALDVRCPAPSPGTIIGVAACSCRDCSNFGVQRSSPLSFSFLFFCPFQKQRKERVGYRRFRFVVSLF